MLVKTLSDYIFTKSIADEVLTGKISTPIFDHYSHFLLKRMKEEKNLIVTLTSFLKNIKNKEESSSNYMHDFRRLNKEKHYKRFGKCSMV